MKFSLSNSSDIAGSSLGAGSLQDYSRSWELMRCGSWMFCYLKQWSFSVRPEAPQGGGGMKFISLRQGSLTALQPDVGSHFSVLSGSWASVSFERKKLTEKWGCDF